METVLNLLSEDMIYALGWTVVHSIWQASLIALFMSFLLKKYQYRSSAARYRVAAFSLFAVLICSLTTFIVYYDLGSTHFTYEGAAAGSLLDLSDNISSSSAIGGIGDFFEKNLSIIVWTWMLGCVLFLIKLVGGMVFLQRLVRSGKPITDERVTGLLANLSNKIKFKKGIALLESARVQTPMMLGHIKPVILFPIGLINRLELEEVEAVLAHEISHIFRNDYIINIIQSLVEVLFYYHPAVWWITANIKTERENCCDDLALKICGNKIMYASALVKLKEIEINSVPNLAIAFSSNNDNLFNRIKRIFDQPENKSNLRERLVMIAFILSSVVLFSFGKKQLTAFTESDECELVEFLVSTTVSDNEANTFEILTGCDTIPKKKKKSVITIEKDDGEKNVIIKVEDGEIEYFEIDGKEIPKEDYDKHMKTLDHVRPLNIQKGYLHSFDFDHDFPSIIYADSLHTKHSDKLIKYFDDVVIDLKGNYIFADSMTFNFDDNQFKKANLYFEKAKDLLDKENNLFYKLNDSTYNYDFNGNYDKALKFYLKAFDSIGPKVYHFKNNDSLFNRFKLHLDDSNNIFHLKDHEDIEILLDDEYSKIYSHPRIKIDKDVQPFVYPYRLEKGYGSTLHWFGRSVQQKILSEMIHDGLIQNNGNEHEIELSGKNLKINGKKMPKEIWQKYKKLYEETQGIELNKKSKIVFKSKLDDHSRLRIRSI